MNRQTKEVKNRNRRKRPEQRRREQQNTRLFDGHNGAQNKMEEKK